MKRKLFGYIIFLFSIFLIGNIDVFASKATCEYQASRPVIYTYEYGFPISYSIADNKYTIKSQDLANLDFIDKNGNIICPKVKISCTTGTKKGTWNCTINKDKNGKSGTLKILVNDGKEKENPSSNNKSCTYNLNNGMYDYSLAWDEDEGKVRYKLHEDISDYDVSIRNCDASHFKNGCPDVYNTVVHKGKQLIIDCENSILTDNDNTNIVDKITDPNTGETTDKKPENDNDDYGEGDVDYGEPVYGCEVIPEEIRKWIMDTLNLVKYVCLALVIILGVIDFIKAAASGEAEQVKKSGNSFLKRIVAVIILFLLPVIVELILNLIEIAGVDQNCFKK